MIEPGIDRMGLENQSDCIEKCYCWGLVRLYHQARPHSSWFHPEGKPDLTSRQVGYENRQEFVVTSRQC